MEITRRDTSEATQPLNGQANGQTSHNGSVNRDSRADEAAPKPLDFQTRQVDSVDVLGKCGNSCGLSAESAWTHPPRAELLVVLEGGHDIRFLKRVSAILHGADPRYPDLGMLERAGVLIFLPVGGDNFRFWSHRLQGLQLREFHLLDREAPPLTAERELAVAAINSRPDCVAQLTRKRSLENYLHPSAIREARGVEVVVDDDMDVPDAVARQIFEWEALVPWETLPSRARRRLRAKAKTWLNSIAAARMTPERLDDRDPQGEVRGWLSAMASLIGLRGRDPDR